MPIIKIQFDKDIVTEEKIVDLSNAMRKIVQDSTGIEDVFVYANCAQINIAIAPIEIFVEMSAHKIKDQDILIQDIKNKLASWKEKTAFDQPINLTLIPMHWKIEIGI